MTFQVEWLEAARNELAQLWTDGDSSLRVELTKASHLIDQLLKSDPINESESRPDGRRITFVAPLAVTYSIDFNNQVVTVVRIHLFRRRSH